MPERLKDEILQEIEDAWLNIRVKNSDLIRPLDIVNVDDPEDFYKRLVWLMSQPDYFSFFCKHVLNIEIHPFQALILSEMWNRKFPMLVASRGAGKSFILALYALLRCIFIPNRKVVVVGSVFRQSKFIHDYMENIWKNAPVLRDMCDQNSGPRRDTDMCKMIFNSSTATALPIGTGEKIRGQRANDVLCLSKDTLIQTDRGLIEIQNYLDGKCHQLLNMNDDFEKPSHILITEPMDVYEIVTSGGYLFKCSDSHRVLTTKGWKRAIELTSEDYLEVDQNNYFPTQHQTDGEFVLNEKMGWLFGLLIAEGCVKSRNSIDITNTDKKLIDKIKRDIPISWVERTRETYKDPRGWDCKESYVLSYCHTGFREHLRSLGIDYSIHKDKEIPSGILQSPRNVVVEFLKGLFDGDGTCFQYEESKSSKQKIRLAYYSRSEKLCRQLQILLLKFNVLSSLISRSSKLSIHAQWMLQINGESAINLYRLLKLDKWKICEEEIIVKKHKPSIRKNGDRYVVSTNKANKNIHIGSYNSETECVEAFDKYWRDTRKCLRVRGVRKLDEKEVLYDFHMPETHSFIGNGFVQHNCDEFASMSRQIFENVIAGFAAVSSNPVDNVRRAARKAYADTVGITLKEENLTISNQIVIAGTAFYDFNHFAEYFKRWRSIINSKGDPRKLQEIFGNDSVPDSFDWRDYSVIRIPVDMLPKGFMDEGQIARSKATVHAGIYNMEFGASFSKDSTGFFKRSLIEACVGSQERPVMLHSGPIFYDPCLRGSPNKQYVIGVDPASEVDNFSVTVIELNKDHRRIVYVWTTNKKSHTERINSGLTKENNFYSYCTRKIRDLMILFPTVRVCVDSQGGGVAIRESLHDDSLLNPGELPIWEIIDENKEKDSDGKSGLHILELCNFANAEWVAAANHGLRQDFENKVLIFPQVDPITIALSLEEDKAHGRLYDTLEDCIVDIEELKNELCLIEMSKTQNGRDKWDTPEVKIGVGRKERIRKDRYSSLLMANAGARAVSNLQVQMDYAGYGGFAERVSRDSITGPDYSGPDWFTSSIKGVY